MANVLKAITHKTQVPIHYSVLPDGLVTATCKSPVLQQLLECLLDGKADLIVRYPRNISGQAGKARLAEAWVLAAGQDRSPTKADCPASAKADSLSPASQTLPEAAGSGKPNPSDALLALARTKNATGRAEAIGSLLTVGTKGDPQIQEMLEEAVHDGNANVRAQALSTLTHWSDNEESKAAALQEAIHDNSVDVRLMAVDGITDDFDLLQQATNDSDEVVRTLATTKLDTLTKKGLEAQ